MPVLKTVQEQINYGKALKTSNSVLNIKDKLYVNGDTIIINYASLLINYNMYLQKYIVDYELSDDDYEKYRYNPKKLSFDLYGTIELATLLLKINNVVSVSEFNKKNIKIFNKGVLDFINEVIIKEDKRIKSNKAEMRN